MARTELGRVINQHVASLPMAPAHRGLRRNWPWIGLFGVVPLGATVALSFTTFTPSSPSGGLLAGIGVLAGLLFGVLASTSGRIATLADSIGTRAATPHEIALITRLDIARANTAYATLISVLFVTSLGITAILKTEPRWLTLVHIFVLLHFGITLILVLLRINSIGEDDRVATLTAHARRPHQARQP